MPDTYPDGALFFAEEAYFKALAAYERDCQLRDELNDGLAEELGYNPGDLSTEDLETLSDFGTL